MFIPCEIQKYNGPYVSEFNIFNSIKINKFKIMSIQKLIHFALHGKYFCVL